MGAESGTQFFGQVLGPALRGNEENFAANRLPVVPIGIANLPFACHIPRAWPPQRPPRGLNLVTAVEATVRLTHDDANLVKLVNTASPGSRRATARCTRTFITFTKVACLPSPAALLGDRCAATD